MRQLYICPKDTWLRAHNSLCFHPSGGSHYIDLPNGLVIVAAVIKDEDAEDQFRSMEGVAPLPHPAFEGKRTLGDHRDDPATAYLAEHHDALKALGIEDTDTVLDASKKTAAIHPLVKIRHIL